MKRLTAAEMRVVTETSTAKVDALIDEALSAIRTNAERGKSMTTVGPVVHSERVPVISDSTAALMTALKSLGYEAYWCGGEPYVPRGLADDDGAGPLYRAYTVKVTW